MQKRKRVIYEDSTESGQVKIHMYMFLHNN
jgi:hypothetical protein